MRVRTKILATMGPATARPDLLKRLIESGLNVCRLNFSHGTLEDHGRMVEMIRDAASEAGRTVGILGDLCGPKIRLDKLVGDKLELLKGQELIFQRQTADGTGGRVSVNYDRLVDDVLEGHRVLIDDGQVRLMVIRKKADELVCVCTAPGTIATRKGVNLPDSDVSIPSITEHDVKCMEWAVNQKLDYLALSFVRSAAAVEDLQSRIAALGGSVHVVAKIEKPEAINAIDQIIEAADGLMVARGDLGVEMDLARVPVIQKDVIRRCASAGKPVIVATQMLQSMIQSPTPTRAEVSDVANAIFDGADAVMLTGETSVGLYPELAVQTMSRVLVETEKYMRGICSMVDVRLPHVRGLENHEAVARGVWQTVRHMDVKLVAVWSRSGRIARFFSKLRFPVPVAGVTDDAPALRRMALYYGVRPLLIGLPSNYAQFAKLVDQELLRLELASLGDQIVLVGSRIFEESNTANGMVIHRVGQAE